MEATTSGQGGGRRGPAWRHWAFGVLGVILIVFILLNAQEVEINFIVGTATAPLIFALAIAGLLGFAVGWLAPRIRRGRERE